MRELETIGGDNWRDLVGAPVAVLMLGKSDCAACAEWTEELKGFLAQDAAWEHVRFGKMLLDQRGLIEFKKETPWLAGVTDLPYNVIYVNGEKVREWAGGGVDRMLNRLGRVTSAP